MRKLALMLSSLAVVGFAVPMSLPAEAATIVIKKGDRGHHYGWYRHGDHRKTVIMRQGERD
jgi:hypothetical protein